MPSDIDDGEDIAIGGDQPEGATATEGTPAAGAQPTDAPKVQLPRPPEGGGVSIEDRPRRREPERTRRGLDRAKLVEAAKKMVEQVDEEDPARELIEPHVEPEPKGPPAGGAAPAKPAPTAGAAKPAEAEAKPDQPVNPDLAAAWDAYDQANAALEARERALSEREASPLVSPQAFLSDPLGAMKALIKAEYGDGAKQDDLDAELADIVTMMSFGLAGTAPAPGNVNHELRQQRRELRHLQLGNRRAAAEQQKAQRAEAEKAQRATAIGALDAELRAVDEKTKVAPIAAGTWLAKHENPAEIVLDVMREQYQRSRNVIPLAVAVKLADARVRKDHLANVTRYHSLLTPTVAPATPAKPNVNQGDHQRRSATLSNAGASESSTPQPREAPLSEEDRRRRTFDKFRPMFQAQARGGDGD